MVEDRLGNKVETSGASAASYYPYGELKSGTASQYGTYLRNSTTGLDYAQQRWYSSQVMRFTSPDPWIGSAKADDPQTWNRYGYVQGDPVNLVDPTGLIIDETGGDEVVYENQYTGSGPTDFGVYGAIPADALLYASVQVGEQVLTFVNGLLGIGPGATPPRKRRYADGPPSICNSKILQPEYLVIFAGMGKTLRIDPRFIMAVSLLESGKNLSHVFETNPSSGGQPLNNLFGVAPGGGNDKAFPSVKASGTWWVNQFGSALSDRPSTIQQFVADLQNNPAGRYNRVNPDWGISIEGGYWTVNHLPLVRKGEHTIGTYQSIVNWMSLCGLTMP